MTVGSSEPGRAASVLPGPRPPAGRLVWRALLVVLVLTSLGDAVAVVALGGRPASAGRAGAGTAGGRTDAAAPGPVPAVPAGPVTPSTLAIPTLGLESGVVAVTVGPGRTLAAPEDASVTGWWSQGSVPGEAGPAVIVGHVDSLDGPAVFFRLHEVRPGDPVRVARSDGKVVTFVVEAVERYRKEALPTEQVYGPTPGPALRLITCGGRFDRRTRSYEDNVVVYAHEAPAGGRS